MILNVKHTEEY